MNILQRLLGIDRLIAAVSSEKGLQAELQEARARNKQNEEEIAELKAQLRQKAEKPASDAAQTPAAEGDQAAQQPSEDKRTIADLQERCKKLSQAISNPQEALFAYLRDKKPSEKKKGKGRPRIEGKRFEFRLDLDISIIVEEAAKIQQRSVARLINDATRQYLASEFEDLFTRLSQPRGKEYDPINPLDETNQCSKLYLKTILEQ